MRVMERGSAGASRVTRRVALAGAGAGGALLAACAGGHAGPQGASPARGPVTIKITARQSPEQDMWPVRVPAFQQAHPQITVEPDLHAGNIQEKTAMLKPIPMASEMTTTAVTPGVRRIIRQPCCTSRAISASQPGPRWRRVVT